MYKTTVSSPLGSGTSWVTLTVMEAADVEMPLLLADSAMLMSTAEGCSVSEGKINVRLRAQEVAGAFRVFIQRTSRQKPTRQGHHPQPTHPKRKSSYFDQPTRFYDRHSDTRISRSNHAYGHEALAEGSL